MEAVRSTPSRMIVTMAALQGLPKNRASPRPLGRRNNPGNHAAAMGRGYRCYAIHLRREA